MTEADDPTSGVSAFLLGTTVMIAAYSTRIGFQSPVFDAGITSLHSTLGLRPPMSVSAYPR